ncbi:hypothetical protein QYM36_004287 [Artemia franciscana]|uniref:Uncharacterized protein n=1 Tax=Artemia franciscana TaxID=6661 RepID=A0AA88I2L4_ARTSF|nr:hypothetical protein QYM36_004287 [Artemia franciscana]
MKLGSMKHFTHALKKDGRCFNYLWQAFPQLTIEKLRAGIFNGPQIRQLIKDTELENLVNTRVFAARTSVLQMANNLLGNTKAKNRTIHVSSMIEAFQKLGFLMSIKMYFMFSRMKKFTQNLGVVSDEQREMFL